jgi:peptidoglycan DL-endopeptidase CwlO
MIGRIHIAILFLALVVAGTAARAGAAVRSHARVAARAAAEQASIVHFARRYLGIPYAYGGVSPRTGFDCSGFTRFVFAHFGIVLPHAAAGQFGFGRRVSRARLRPGDLVFFDGLGHVGLYIGGGRFIHAPHTGVRVEVDSLSGWYGARYDGARRIL